MLTARSGVVTFRSSRLVLLGGIMAATASPVYLPSKSCVLVASANAQFRKTMMASDRIGLFRAEEALGGAHALAQLQRFPCHSVLIDRKLPDLDAEEVCEAIRARYPDIEVQILDAQAAEELSPCTEEPSRAAVRAIAEAPHHSTAYHEAEWSHGETSLLPGMVGSSHAMQQVSRLVHLVAQRETTVLITGETGTGKELVANAVHQLSGRSKHPFVVVNCAAIPEALLEAELFGHARGAFTGAVQSRLGRIHVAQGGTLFLDEVGELPLSMQAKLLRFLQNGEVQRLGSSDVHRVDVRVVCATNVRLPDLVANKQFRQDLYYRLSVFPILLPPLRQRLGDVAQLAVAHLARLCAEMKQATKEISDGALQVLLAGEWPGNVRELHHALERALILSGNDRQIRAEHFHLFGDYEQLGAI